MRFTTTLSVETIRVVRTCPQRDDELQFALFLVDLIVIAMAAEMAGGIHCRQAVQDGHDDEEKGGELHC